MTFLNITGKGLDFFLLRNCPCSPISHILGDKLAYGCAKGRHL